MRVNFMFVKLALAGLVGIFLSLHLKAYWAARFHEHGPMNMTKYKVSLFAPYIAVGITVVCLVLAFVARPKLTDE